MRDLLDLNNSENLRVSKSKCVVKNLTEQYISNATDAIALIEKSLQNRRYKLNKDSFLLL
jgi:hypothetical protein